jgi:hypothetical protein
LNFACRQPYYFRIAAYISTIQFYDVDKKTLQLILRHQQATEGLPFSIFYAHDLMIAPALGILKTHYDSTQTKHFIDQYFFFSRALSTGIFFIK